MQEGAQLMEVSTSEAETAIVLSLITRREILLAKPTGGRERERQVERFVSFVKAVTAKSRVSQAEGGLLFSPGTLSGGELFFDCEDVPIAYFLYHILPIAGFFKRPLRIVLKGATNKSDPLTPRRLARGQKPRAQEERCAGPWRSAECMSVDAVKAVLCKVLARFGVCAELKINRRSMHPSADGEVVLLADTCRSLESASFERKEKLERIVCVNYSSRIGSDVIHRMTNHCRDVLKEITSSVKVYNDVGNKTNTGKTPGYGTLLLASGENSLYFSECAIDGDVGEAVPAEAVSALAIKELLKTMKKSGAFDHKIQSFLFVLLALTKADVSTLLIKRICPGEREVLNLLGAFLNYAYTIEKYSRTEEEIEAGVPSELLLIKSYGVGYENIYKAIQ